MQFDTQDPYEVVHRFVPIQGVPELTRKTYVPRASTPLLDAMGRGINDLEKSLSALKEEDRPSRVIMAVVTDGQENSSQEFRKDQIEKMIRERTEADGWQFAFLSADLAAISDALCVGIPAHAALLYESSSKGTSRAWTALASRTSEYRSGRKRKFGFEQADREHPEQEP
ncbi:MAG: hypothetical protein FJX73_04625 [Armatimonadetes bacterium]|nr:hypothetical protein [Armatimonadota bacterium]